MFQLFDRPVEHMEQFKHPKLAIPAVPQQAFSHAMISHQASYLTCQYPFSLAAHYSPTPPAIKLSYLPNSLSFLPRSFPPCPPHASPQGDVQTGTGKEKSKG